jgi:lipoate-protein ligase B
MIAMTPPAAAGSPAHRRVAASLPLVPAAPVRRPARAAWLGRLDYDEALAMQQRIHALRVAGTVPDTLLLLEHDSTYTSGRAADPHHFLVPPEELERQGHAVRQTHRGGDVTWHGPGQLIAYPIVDLSTMGRDVHSYLRLLEDVLIRTCAESGVAAWREVGRTGAWTQGGKIGAIGIRVARWITMHGIALNVAPDLARFGAIVPCGLSGERVTSIELETGRRLQVPEVAATLARMFADVFHVEFEDSVTGLAR